MPSCVEGVECVLGMYEPAEKHREGLERRDGLYKGECEPVEEIGFGEPYNSEGELAKANQKGIADLVGAVADWDCERWRVRSRDWSA